MRKTIFILFATLVLSFVCDAQNKIASTGDMPEVKPKNFSSLQTYALNSTATSPIRDLPKSSDRVFVKDEEVGGLDTGCVFSDSSPLRIKLPINRVIDKNSVDGSITATQASTLIQKGYLSEYAVIKLPVYDVDILGGEIDKISVNGVDVGVLSGSNNTWKLNEFKFPIWLLKFGTVDPYGGPSRPSENIIEIHIDTSGDEPRWCTEVDWLAVSFKALSPVFFVHGNTSKGAFFTDNGFTKKLDEEAILYDNSFNFEPNANSIAINASKLGLYFYSSSRKYGVDSFHLVVHSKGGLDSRAFLADYYNANGGVFSKSFKIISFTSLGTPHNGSVGADLSSGYVRAREQTTDIQFPNLPAFTALLADLNYTANGKNAGHEDLRTDSSLRFNNINIPRLQQLRTSGILGTIFNTVTADADKNGTQKIDQVSEWLELKNDDPMLWGMYEGTNSTRAAATKVVNNLYQLIRRQKSISLGFLTAQDERGTIKIATLTGVPNTVPLGNDTLVNLESGRGKGYFENLTTHRVPLGALAGRNHSSIADANVAAMVIPWFVEADRFSGDLK